MTGAIEQDRVLRMRALRAELTSCQALKSATDEWDDETIQRLGEGHKADAEKPRLDLIPPELLFALGDVLAFGAQKYGERNWEKGMSWGRIFAALMRHMWAWLRGDKADAETGFSHLHHAACCIAFLVAYEARGIGVDDRVIHAEVRREEG